MLCLSLSRLHFDYKASSLSRPAAAVSLLFSDASMRNHPIEAAVHTTWMARCVCLCPAGAPVGPGRWRLGRQAASPVVAQPETLAGQGCAAPGSFQPAGWPTCAADWCHPSACTHAAWLAAGRLHSLCLHVGNRCCSGTQ